MKRFVRLSIFLSLQAVMLSFTGCKIDRSIDFNKEFDTSITVGDYFSKKLTSQKYYLEDLVSLKAILEMNGLDPSMTWDQVEALDLTLLIPNILFGPFAISSLGITENDVDTLTGTGSLYIVLDAISSLPIDVQIMLEFIHPGGIVKLMEKPVTIYGEDKGGKTDPNQLNDLRIEINAEQLRALARSTEVRGTVINENLHVKLRRDAFIEFSFIIEKRGGVTL